MEAASVAKLVEDALWVTIIISAPPLVVSVVVGLIISILQAATSIQEQTLTFVPKLFAVFLTLILASGFIINVLTSYTKELFDLMALIPQGALGG